VIVGVNDAYVLKKTTRVPKKEGLRYLGAVRARKVCDGGSTLPILVETYKKTDPTMFPQHTPLVGSYDYRLVALSVVIATFASYAALDLVGRLTVARGSARLGWLAGGAGAMGLGIWSMHYIGMLAFRLSIPVWYDWPMVLLSLSAAILASAAALHVASGQGMGLRRTVVGSVVMGGGIGAMHYIGMNAMQMSAMCHFDRFVVILSVISAVLISFIALRLVFLARNHNETGRLRKIASAVVMGAAIPIMHYTGMAAASFTVSDQAPDLSHAVAISTLGMVGLAAVTIMILGITTLTAAYSRLMRETSTMRTRGLSARIRALRAAMTTFCVMVVFEVVKRVVQPGMSIWTSRTITIVFATLVAAILSFTILRKEEQLRFELGRSETQYRLLFDSNPLPTWVFSRSTLQFLAVNEATIRHYGFSRPEFLAMTIADIRPEEDIPPLLEAIAKRINGLQAAETWRHRKKDAAIIDVEVVSHELDFQGTDAELVAVHDITERNRIEQALRQAEEKYRTIFEDAVVAIFQSTPCGRYTTVNPAMAQMMGYDSPDELIASITDISQQVYVDPKRREEFKRLLREQGTVKGFECQIYRKDRSTMWISANVRAIFKAGVLVGYEGLNEDITARKAAEERVQFLAYYDALTGLPNRTLLKDRLATAISGARRRHESVALLFLDLDRFKIINDSLGHSLGDLLLQDVAARLKTWAREQDTVSRLGGDEFLIALTGIKDVADVAVAAQRLMNKMAIEFVVQDRSFSISCSLGISIFPEHGADGETLIRNADAAMYSAKENGRNNFRFFTEDMNAQAVERLTLENSLRRVLDRKELFLMYQPQMDIATGKIVGLEALLRWKHPELGLVPPDRFIRIAENSGLILPIGEWALRTACSQLKRWQEDGLPTVSVAVNVSAVQFRHEGFCKLVRGVLHETGLAPQYLELEITESLLLSNADVVFSVFRELRAMGLRLAIDDFGTGYSSLSYLKQFPVSKLKIDRSFIRDIAVNPDDAAITSAIISLAKSLNLKVIAEGVENEAQMSFLRSHQCDEIQGYYFSKPISIVEVADKLRGTAPYLACL
jgi:diguanylate cyclase (GGDEF)-like protein/PAS domain S-box-containing protein